MVPAKTTTGILIQGTNLLAGQTRTYYWHITYKNAVYSFSVWPLDAQNNPLLENKVRVQNVRAMTTMDDMTLYFDVQNWGTVWCDFFVMVAITTPQ